MHRIVGLFVLALFALGGCKNEPVTVGGKPKEKYPQTIVSLSPGATEIIWNSGRSMFLKGRTSACNEPPGVKAVPVVATTKPNYEKIAELKPDLIVYDEDLYSEADLKKLEQLGAELLEIEGNTLEEFEESLFEYAVATNAESTISSKVDKIQSARATSQATPATPTPKVAIIMPGQTGEHLIAGTKSLQADVVRAATGEPVGPDADRFVKMNAESLVQMNPDIIILSGAPDDFLKDTRFKSLNAVQKGRVFGANPDVLLRRGWRVDSLIERLHKLFLESMSK